MRATRLAIAGSVVTTLIAGLYFVVYIYRWEMHRALISGVVFLAGEIALATALVIRRLDSLRAPAPAAATASTVEPAPSPSPSQEQVPVPTPAPVPTAPATAATTAPSSSAPAPTSSGTASSANGSAPKGNPQAFPWLGADRFSVFVPILLGAGTIVSGVSWVVEHLARSTGSSRGGASRLERRLATLTPPTLVPAALGGGAIATEPVDTSDEDRGSRGLLLRRVAAVLLIGGLAGVLLTLALLGRSRSEPPVEGTRSVVTMTVETRNGVDVDVAARSLWGSCNVWVPSYHLAEMRSPAPGLYELVIEPSLGEQAEKRLFGCLNDGTLERVNAQLHGHERITVDG